jgi:hypothetical protein
MYISSLGKAFLDLVIIFFACLNKEKGEKEKQNEQPYLSPKDTQGN